MSNIILKKFNNKKIDLCDDLTRYFLSMKDKNFQADWLSKFPITYGHDRQNISFEFNDDNESIYLVYFADNKDFNNSFIVETKDKHIDNVGIFIPGKTYYWKVIDKINKVESDIDSFCTLNSNARWISAGTVYNMRDLGGWITTDNKRVKYSLIYRGGQLKLDNKWEKSYMNEYSYKVFDYLKIKTEVELRGGYDHELSQIYDDTKNICINGVGYENFLCMTDEQRCQYRNLFKELANRNNYPLYFHCSWGADRTGVLAFLINGVLGVDYDTLSMDYELTSFSGSGRRSRIICPWKNMCPELENRYGKNKSLKDILNEYLIEYVGVKQEEIDELRNIMLEDERNDEHTHKVTYMVDDKLYFESLVFDGFNISSTEPGIYTSRCLNYWIHNNKKFDFNEPVYSDLILEAKMENVEYEEYDVISLKDIGLGKSYDLKEAKDFPYIIESNNKGVIFKFDYKIECKDNKFDDGVHIEIGTLWDYKAHIWFQNLETVHTYINKDSLSFTNMSNFEYLKTYRIEIGVLTSKNKKNKGNKMLILKINDEIKTIVKVDVDLSIHSIGIAGTKGILYNVD